MIIDSITLKNFGVYAGKQEISLAPTDPNKPITLFGGLNGGGKTTLLEAIQLALYGPKARLAGRGKLAYREYLRAMIHHGVDTSDGASIEIRFRRAVEGDMVHYRLQRSWREGLKGIEDRIEVNRDAEPDPVLSENWDEYIENYIPSGISHLFFFDAEQIKDLAEGQHAAEILGTAIHTLLGLDLVDRLETDLIALERRKRIETKTGEQAEKAQRAQDDLLRMQKLVEEAAQSSAALMNEVVILEKSVGKAETRFRQEGGELYLIQADLEGERKKILDEIEKEEKELREIAAGPAPLLLVSGLLEETREQAIAERETSQSRMMLETLEIRDTKILSEVKRRLDQSSWTLLEKLFEKDRSQRAAQTKGELILGAGEGLATEIQHLLSTVLPQVKEQVSLKLSSLAGLQERLTRLELELARVPTRDAIADLQRDLDVQRKKLQAKKAELSAQEDKCRVLQRQYEDADRNFRRELGEEVEAQVSREQVGRILKHSAKVRTTLGKFRSAVIRKHAQRLERLVLDSFQQLLRKSSLVTGLRIDPSTFQIELTGGNGKPLSFDRLSAGERQLLATSLLWGLAKASGRPLPTIIDTPLGRLDSSHRRHLIERYFPVASHQVVLLSTDEEIDEESWKRLQPFIGRSYQLKFDDKTRSTKVKPGYFWNHETTH